MKADIDAPVIGIMHAPFKQKFGIPRQSNLVNSVSYIEMNPPYDDLNGFVGLAEFSHIWLLWQFHDNKRKNKENDYMPLIRPPRLGGNQKIGVFASRSMYRPSQIGLSVVQFLRVERINQHTRVYVRGADLLHGTPIVDIKPYLAYADSIPEAKSGYAQHVPTVFDVVLTTDAQQQKQQLMQLGCLDEELFTTLTEILALNPKPAYQQDPHKVYGLSFSNLNVQFKIDQIIEVVALTLDRVE